MAGELSPDVESLLETFKKVTEFKRVHRRAAEKLAVKDKFKREFRDGYKEGFRVINYVIREDCPQLAALIIDAFKVDPKVPENNTLTTSVHHAAIMDQLVMLEKLMNECQCQIDAKDIHGSTALHLAILFVKTSAAIWLVDHGASLQVCSYLGTPLHMAALLGNFELVQKLHEKNSHLVNCELYEFCTPLVASMFRECSESDDCFQLLAEATDSSLLADKSLASKVIICNSSEERALKYLKILLNRGVNLKLFDEALHEEQPIICAAKRGWASVVEFLLTETDQIHGVDWSVAGILGYVASEEFTIMDDAQRQIRLNALQNKLITELTNKRYLVAELIYRILRYDMDEEAYDRYNCIYEVMTSVFAASHVLQLSAHSLHLFGVGCFGMGNNEIALKAAKASLALEPDNGEYQAFYDVVVESDAAPGAP